MRITFVGTSYGRPIFGRRCSCTMIETGGKIYFVDMGTMVLEDLVNREAPMKDVAAIFITHMHGDHVNGLPHFMQMTNGHIDDCDPAVYLPEETAADSINAWMKAIHIDAPRKRDYRVTKPGLIYDDGIIRVTAEQTKHTEHSFAYIIEAEGKTVCFAGDLERPDVDFPKSVYGRELEMIVLEGQHFHPDEYIPHLKKMSAKRIVITHYSFNKTQRIFDFADHLWPDGKVYAAHDGLVFDI